MLGLVQMGSSARLFDNHCGSQSGLGESEIGTVTFCRRCQLGIVVGIFTAIFSVVVIGFKLGVSRSGKLPWLFTAELVLSVLIVGGQAISVGFLTGQEGPAAPLNNLYYSTWGSLAVGMVLVGSCVENWSTAKSSLRDGEEGVSLSRC
jgi:uncharacterized membrane protein YczE